MPKNNEKVPAWATEKWGETSTRGINEFKWFVQERLLPILGIKNENPLISNVVSRKHITVDKEKDGERRVLFSAGGRAVYIAPVPADLPEFTMEMGSKIIDAFLDISCLYVKDNRLHNYYPNQVTYEKMVDAAIENGICRYCAGSNSESFFRLISSLETWAVKTYEGKKVSFGFLFNPDKDANFSSKEEKEKGKTWLGFLKSDYAASLSDGIHSLIELDKDCNLCGFLSLTAGGRVDAYKLCDGAPYRFAQVIQSYVTGSRVGVFLLNNGDIVLAKGGEVRVVKRNLKWLNISFKAFSGFITAELEEKPTETLLRSIYASVLDVSFSHTGGIIAWIRNNEEWKKLTVPGADNEAIIDPCDDLRSRASEAGIEKRMIAARGKIPKKEKPMFNREIEMRLLKRKVVKTLICNSTFPKMDRKLRAELIAMDGACVIDWKGRVRAVGAIIQNDSGSAGGGRTAAAKKLARYGFAIKISTDGYIEAFVGEDNVYSVK